MLLPGSFGCVASLVVGSLVVVVDSPLSTILLLLGALMHPTCLTLDEKPLTVIISNDKMLNINHATRYCRCMVQFRCSEI